jgi:hypothetical protein
MDKKVLQPCRCCPVLQRHKTLSLLSMDILWHAQNDPFAALICTGDHSKIDCLSTPSFRPRFSCSYGKFVAHIRKSSVVIPRHLSNSWSYFVVVLGKARLLLGASVMRIARCVKKRHTRFSSFVMIIDLPIGFISVNSGRWCLPLLKYSPLLSRLA